MTTNDRNPDSLWQDILSRPLDPCWDYEPAFEEYTETGTHEEEEEKEIHLDQLSPMFLKCIEKLKNPSNSGKHSSSSDASVSRKSQDAARLIEHIKKQTRRLQSSNDEERTRPRFDTAVNDDKVYQRLYDHLRFKTLLLEME
ncbi:hypothetical protein HDU76_001331, partial [Blyttiomyces sp. JEL0837]